LLFQNQLPTSTPAWLFERAARRNLLYEDIYERNSLREEGLDPQWMLLGTVGQEWKKISGCCCKTCPIFMEAEQEERPSDPGVQQVTSQH